MNPQYQELTQSLSEQKSKAAHFIEAFCSHGYGHPTKEGFVFFLQHTNDDLSEVADEALSNGMDFQHQSLIWATTVLNSYPSVGIELLGELDPRTPDASEMLISLYESIDENITVDYENLDRVAELTSAIEVALSLGFEFEILDNEDVPELICELEGVMQNRILWLENNTLSEEFISRLSS